MADIVFWNDSSEVLLIVGIIGSFISLLTVLLSILFVIYNIVKKNGISDNEISQTSSMVMVRSGKNLIRFAIAGLIVSLFPPISYAFLKSNAILGEKFNPFDLCQLSWFLEYFTYEVSKILISIFLIYRLYSSFDNSLYHIPKKYVTCTFFLFIPLLIFSYIILVLLATFLPEQQFKINITYNGYMYCGYNYVSIVFIFCRIASFFREIGFGSFILYTYISRLHAMNIQAKKRKTNKQKKKNKKKNKKNKKKKTTKNKKKSIKKLAETQEKHSVIELNVYFSIGDDEDEEARQKKETMTKDSKFNMLGRRGLIVRYVFLIVVMIISSWTSQILLCFISYPTFYIPFDIVFQTVCLVLMTWIGKGIWGQMVKMFYCVCLCKYLCPIIKKTKFQRKVEN